MHWSHGLQHLRHKRLTFAFASESGYTLAFAQRIAHRRSQGETWVLWMEAPSLPSDRFARSGDPAWPGLKTANFAAFGSWPGVLSKNAESLRSSDALMRVAAPRRRGPAGLRDLFRFCRSCGLYTLRSVLSECARRGVVSLPSACFACCRNTGRPLVKAVYLSFSCVPYLHLRKLPQGTANIRIDTDRLLLDLPRTHCLPLVDTGVDRLGIFCRHLPEGVLDDDRGIIANA